MDNNENNGTILLDSKHIVTTIKSLYDIKLVECGDYLQVYLYKNKKIKTRKNDDLDLKLPKKYEIEKIFEETNLEKEDKEIKLSNNIEKRSIIRSKLSCQRIAKSNIREWHTFITLTFEENITDIARANKRFRYYVDKIQRVKKNFKYLCIPEFQKRGAVHYHLLTNLKCGTECIAKKPLKRLYNPSSKQWKELNYYDLKYWHEGFSCAEEITGDVKKIIGYISKYMTKDIDNRLFNRHRYFYSRNLIEPHEDFINTQNEKAKDYYIKKIQDMELIYQNEYANPYDDNKVVFLELLKK